MRFKPAVLAAAFVCLAHADANAQLRAQQIAAGFTLPVAFVQDPLNRNIWFVVQQNGHIRTVRDGGTLPADFLDVSGEIAFGGEQGLLGMAFTPDTASTGRFFVNFTNRSGHTVLRRYRRADPITVDQASRFDLRWNGPGSDPFIVQPFANHNGGHLAFGPDGYLYIGMGDGGAGNDPGNRSQTPGELLGKMLRIDVNVPDSHATGYQIPSDNPFVSGGGIGARPEIWSFGLRNPWRYNFDDPRRGGSGALIIGDVGQGLWEELDYEPPNRGGRNYGWRIREGAHDNVTSLPPAYTPLIEPIHEYSHSVGQSITGGFVYRGTGLPPQYPGRYFFADFVAGRVWSLALNINPATREATASDVGEHTAELSNAGALGNISSFGVDADGELILVGYSSGKLLRIVSGIPRTPTGLRIVPQG